VNGVEPSDIPAQVTFDGVAASTDGTPTGGQQFSVNETIPAITFNLVPTTTDPDAVLNSVSFSGFPLNLSTEKETQGFVVETHDGTILTINTGGISGSVNVPLNELNGLLLGGLNAGQSLSLTVTATSTDNGQSFTTQTHFTVDEAATSAHSAVLTPPGTIPVTAQFDSTHDVLSLNNQTVITSMANETVQLTDAGHPGATLSASGNQFAASGSNDTLDLSGWDRAVEIDFANGTIALDAALPTSSGTISGFANVLGTAHNDSFDNLAGGITVTGGAGAINHFGLAANVLNSSSVPTITNFNAANESIDLSALLDAKFGPGSDATKAPNFVQLKEDAGGNSATLEINVNGTPGGTFVAAAHLGGVHSGDVVTAVLDHAHTTAQLHSA
jgi:hypothetical protein